MRRPARGRDRVHAAAVLQARLLVARRTGGRDTRRRDRRPCAVRLCHAVRGVTTGAGRGREILPLLQLDGVHPFAVRPQGRRVARAALRRHIGWIGAGQRIALREHIVTAVAGHTTRRVGVPGAARHRVAICRGALRLPGVAPGAGGDRIRPGAHLERHLAVAAAAAERSVDAARERLGRRGLVARSHAHLLSGAPGHREQPAHHSEPQADVARAPARTRAARAGEAVLQ